MNPSHRDLQLELSAQMRRPMFSAIVVTAAATLCPGTIAVPAPQAGGVPTPATALPNSPERAEAIRVAEGHWTGLQSHRLHPTALRESEWTFAHEYLRLSPAQQAEWKHSRERILLELDRRFANERSSLIKLSALAQGARTMRFPAYEDARKAYAELLEHVWSVHQSHITAFGTFLSDEQLQHLDALSSFLERSFLKSHLQWCGMRSGWPDVEHLAMEFLFSHLNGGDEGTRILIDRLFANYRDARLRLLRECMSTSSIAMMEHYRALEHLLSGEPRLEKFDADGTSLEAQRRLLRSEQRLADLNIRTVDMLAETLFDDARTALQFEYAWFAASKPIVLRHLPSPPEFYSILDGLDIPEDSATAIAIAMEIEIGYTEMMLDTRRISEALRHGYETIAYRRRTSAADNEPIQEVSARVCTLVERRLDRTTALMERVLTGTTDAGIRADHPQLQSLRVRWEDLKAIRERLKSEPCRAGVYNQFS